MVLFYYDLGNALSDILLLNFSSSHDKTSFCLRGFQTYLITRVLIRGFFSGISFVKVPNKPKTSKNRSSRTEFLVTFTMILIAKELKISIAFSLLRMQVHKTIIVI